MVLVMLKDMWKNLRVERGTVRQLSFTLLFPSQNWNLLHKCNFLPLRKKSGCNLRDTLNQLKSI